MIAGRRSRLPQGRHRGKARCDEVVVYPVCGRHFLGETAQTCLMRQGHGERYGVFSAGGEFRPERGDAHFVIEFAPAHRLGDERRHRRLAAGKNSAKRRFPEWFALFAVRPSRPEIGDQLALAISRKPRAELVAAFEIPRECVDDVFEARPNETLDVETIIHVLRKFFPSSRHIRLSILSWPKNGSSSSTIRGTPQWCAICISSLRPIASAISLA